MLNPIYRAHAVFGLLLLVFTIACHAEPQDLTDSQLTALLKNTTVYGKFIANNATWKAYFASNGRVYFLYTDGKFGVGSWHVRNNMVCFQFDKGTKGCKTANPQGKFYEWRDNDTQRRLTSLLVDFRDGDLEGLERRALQTEVRSPTESSKQALPPTTTNKIARLNNNTTVLMIFILGLIAVGGLIWQVYLCRKDKKESIPRRILIPNIFGIVVTLGFFCYGLASYFDYRKTPSLEFFIPCGKAIVMWVSLVVKSYFGPMVIAWTTLFSVYYLFEYGELRAIPIISLLLNWIFGNAGSWVQLAYLIAMGFYCVSSSIYDSIIHRS